MHERIGGIECRRLRAASPLPTVAEQHGNRTLQRVDRIEFNAIDECCFIGIALRHDEFAKTGVTCAEHHRQYAADRAQRAVECKFAECNKTLDREAIDLLVDCKQRERNGQIEGRPLFAHVGRREVNQKPARRVGEARIENRGAHALARLGKRAVGEPDDRQRRGTGGTIGLNPNDIAFDTKHPGAE